MSRRRRRSPVSRVQLSRGARLGAPAAVIALASRSQGRSGQAGARGEPAALRPGLLGPSGVFTTSAVEE